MTSATPAQKKRAKPPLKSDRTKQFEKDWRRLEQAGRANLHKVKEVMLLLIANSGPLPAEWRDHALQGPYEGHRDCHAAGDLVLIYKIDGESVVFVRLGTHADLFE